MLIMPNAPINKQDCANKSNATKKHKSSYQISNITNSIIKTRKCNCSIFLNSNVWVSSTGHDLFIRIYARSKATLFVAIDKLILWDSMIMGQLEMILTFYPVKHKEGWYEGATITTMTRNKYTIMKISIIYEIMNHNVMQLGVNIHEKLCPKLWWMFSYQKTKGRGRSLKQLY